MGFASVVVIVLLSYRREASVGVAVNTNANTSILDTVVQKEL
jgi:hypothetical protein